ncbi:MAG TPA: HNH endonuclease [Kofleriaceae bacterium]|nr:HNH endonuclease [Kofleriaceae bacterium]
MIKVLPSIAQLLAAPIERNHAPLARAQHDRAYEQFRACLRWEFAFACPFCLLHEAQVCPAGAAGSAQYWIEHIEPQSDRPDLRNVYSNVVYACRRCNLARRSRPRVDSAGRRLLDPCSDIWAVHFLHQGDELCAQTSDAAYTLEAYDLNCPEKVALRRDRREAIDEAMHVLATVPALLDQLMTGIDFQGSQEQRLRLELAEHLHKALAASRRTLIQLAAIPHDANPDCACVHGACVLSSLMDSGLLHVELEPGRE